MTPPDTPTAGDETKVSKAGLNGVCDMLAECLNEGEQLREAVRDMAEHLKSIADNTCCDPCREAALVAAKPLQKHAKLIEGLE